MKPTTLRDVAREAGVSVASVSRVINGHDNVRAETSERIREVIRRLRYVPHSGARSLSTRRTHVVGVVLPDLYGEFFSEIIRGIDAAARARGLHLLVSCGHDDAEETASAVRAMRGRVDGLVVMSPHVDGSLLADNLPDALPIVLVNSPVADRRHATLAIDSYRGARDMVGHLIACGHRRIAHISGPERNFDAKERLRGYRDELAGSPADASPLVLTGDFSQESGYLAGRELAAMSAPPDAIFAANDMMAIGCLVALHEAGLRIPRDIGLVGFDDIPLASFVQPALTTVRVRIAELGGSALEELAASIDAGARPARPRRRVIRPELIVRESCGTRPGTGPRPVRQRRNRSRSGRGKHHAS